MVTVYKRELAGFFHTSMGYVFLGVFMALSGLIFYVGNLRPLSGDLLGFLSQLTLLLMLLCPLLTMRLICEERQKRTDQLLLTSPVSLTAIVLGKYGAAATVLLASVLLTHVYVLIIGVYGTLYLGEWFVGYLGFILQGLSFLALDMLVTCFAKNQLSAAMAAFAANFMLWLLDVLAQYVPVGLPADALRFISLYGRYEPFILGQLSYASILFFITFIVASLVATIHVMDARRFSQGGAA
ncbi:MAG: ABC transporter permease [Clostridiales bacterium]|nr:ABC transporter permease [Clostridiales bacterium]